MAKERRFQISETQSNLTLGGNIKIILDTETGVQYLYHGSGYGGGICPLLDRDGKPLLAEGYQDPS